MSQYFIIVLVYDTINTPLNVYRLAIGPVSEGLFWISLFLLRICAFWITLIGFEYLFIKYLAVVIWKRILPIVDDFFGLFILLANFSISAVLAMIPPMLANISFDHLKFVGLYYIPLMTLPMEELQ